MKISPLYQVLIYLEHNGQANADEIKKWGSAVSRGILGKMEAMELIDRLAKDNSVYFSLSNKGYVFLNSVLDVLHRGVKHWDNKWRVVWFSVPEKERPKRDKFRRALEGFGLRPVLGSAWVTPLDLKSDIGSAAKKFNVGNSYILIEAENLFGMDRKTLIGAWNFNKYRVFFEEFISRATKLLNQRPRPGLLELKALVFEYALILNGEPRLPIELMPKDWPEFRASLIYKKIRRLITQ